ncbi:hypothetical protein Fmac_027835 [Flemingia macrophylla]|uniref:WAT1-related protein n=1 Tax=Flemingia macrophylla TaxID=520843 RepID=A0ABD1LIU3_9FABA
MSNNECAFEVMYGKYKLHLVMVLVQLAFSFLYFLLEASLNKGLNPHVFVTFRHAVGGIVVLPFAYVRERKAWPKLTMTLFMELFFLSLFGISLTLNMFFASMKYTTPSFVASMTNTISPLTFIFAVGFRLEVVDVKKPRGLAKVFGTVLSLIGALIMTLYKGHAIQSLQGAPFHIREKSAIIVKKYPAQLTLTAWINCMGAVQSAAFTVLVQHKPTAWFITSTIELSCILYARVICGGIVIFCQFWTTEQKGPVFVSMFNPIGTVLVTMIAYFLFGEQLHLGSLLGVIIIIIGQYFLLWGKNSDGDYKSQQSFETHVEQKECRTEIKTSTEQDVP